MPLAATCVVFEIITLSEVTQKEKDKYCILTRVWNPERCSDESICRVAMEMQT